MQYFLALFLIAVAGHLAAEPLRIATGESPPFASAAMPEGGLINRRVARAAAAAGFEVEFVYMPWRRALEQTRLARFDATSYWYRSDERAADFIHVGPIMEDRAMFFVRSDRNIPEWNDLSELSGLRIGGVAGYAYTAEFWRLAEEGVLHLELAPSDEANIRKLLAGRIDMYPVSEATMGYVLDQIETLSQQDWVVTTGPALTVSGGYLLVPRSADNAEHIAKGLQAALQTTPELIGATKK